MRVIKTGAFNRYATSPGSGRDTASGGIVPEEGIVPGGRRAPDTVIADWSIDA